jgi:hypothetical protein
MKDIKLLKLLHEMINEVGDLQNIQPFDYTITDNGGEFDAFLNNEKVKVETTFTESPSNINHMFSFPPVISPNHKKIYNIGFSIRNNDEQFSKENYHILIRILKTVVNIITDSLSKYPKDSIFVFFATSKIGKGFEDPQKMKLYKLIMQNNLPSGYRMGTAKFLDNELIFLTNNKN